MIDFHGSTGYGQAFTDSISQNWGSRPLEDLKKGLNYALDKYTFIDGNNACALGASYGAYMINWIESHWQNQFKCLVNHDGVFDNRMMYYSTEELWFVEWENGGPYSQT
ncbi:MAG: prolyl oligopeptidase family serine peptidase [Enterobacterales bacterium]|nr:prolyl oligopeptidase family serine peptidase [Enterobacterales bacterium]